MSKSKNEVHYSQNSENDTIDRLEESQVDVIYDQRDKILKNRRRSDIVHVLKCNGKNKKIIHSNSRKNDGDAILTTLADNALIPRYKMNHVNRGYAVIINNINFEPHTGLSYRGGSEVDERSLVDIFTRLKFSVVVKHDVSSRGMISYLKTVSIMDHTNFDCFVLVILSHGIEGHIYGTDGILDLNSMIQFFNGQNCSSLLGKPKLFFIQACRGDTFDEGQEYVDGPDTKSIKLPCMSDMLIAYSVVPGYFSWRNNVKGSWFIQAFTKAMSNYSHLEILKILTLTNYYVAYEFESRTRDPFLNRKKQIPCIMSMLTKDLFFEVNESETNQECNQYFEKDVDDIVDENSAQNNNHSYNKCVIC